MSFSRCWLFCMGALLSVSISACGGQQERIIVTTERARPSDQSIDADPWSLLPRGAIAWFRSGPELLSSAFADRLGILLDERLPLASSAPFHPREDVELIVGGIYATVGSDFVAICRGDFDLEGLRRAQEAATKTKAGRDLHSTQFAGATLYVSERIALAPLTPQTVVVGTQLGVRRVLEVVEERRMGRHLPLWFETLLDDGGAHFQLGIDLDAQPVPAVFRTDWEFMNHLRAGRVVGNFEAPGLNFAASMTFSDPQSAQTAADTVRGTNKKLEQYEVLLKTMKLENPIRKLEAVQIGKDTQVVAELSGQALVELWSESDKILGDVELGQWLVN